MANKENTNDPLLDYLKAVNENNNEDLIKILTSEIEKTCPSNKTGLMTLLIYRAKAYFRINNYNMAVNDCIRLKTMGYEFENDEYMALIFVECQWRIISEESIKLLNKISIKFNNKQAASSANKIDAIDMNKIFNKDDLLQRQDSMKNKN